jgi:hypothetical protein
MSTEKVFIDKKSANSEEEDVFLQAIVKSSNRKKILVRFKFKDVGTEFQEWMTCSQYNVLRTIGCLEFCSV